jgi:hypothetical protein
VLRSEAEGLVVTEPSGADRRVRTARLTRAGLAERAELDRRSDELAGSIIGPLSGPQRGRLAAAIGEVERLLTASAIRLGGCDPGDTRSLTVLTVRVRRPLFIPPDPASRTEYRPGELAQCDLWSAPVDVTLGFGQVGRPPVWW